MQRISKGKISLYGSLGKKKFREKEGLFKVEGAKSLRELLASGFNPEAVVVVAPDASGATALIGGDMAPILESLEVRGMLFEAGAAEMKKLSSLSEPPLALGIFRLPSRREAPVPARGELCLALDGIQDPGNLGSILRSADWFGVTRVYASPDTADVFNPKALMATMGSLARVEIFYTDLTELIGNAKGIPVYGTLLDGENIYKASLGAEGIIVMGNEGKGISPALRKLITNPLLIPPALPDSHAESLNVGVATGIVLSEFRRK